MMMQSKVNTEQLLEAVRLHPFFHGVDFDTALSLIAECEEKFFYKKEVLHQSDEQRRGLLYVLEGSAEVFVKNEVHGREEVLEVVQKGELLGFSSLADFLGVARDSTIFKEEMVKVRACEPMKALFIPFAVLAKRWDDPGVHDYLLTQVAVRIKDIYGSLAEQVKQAGQFGESDAFKIRVQDVMSEVVVAVEPDTTIQAAAQKMVAEQTSSVLVLENCQLRGIITERDLVSRVIAEAIPLSTPAQEVMTCDPVTISRRAHYYEALSTILLKRVKHLPVIGNGQIVGIVTLSDLLRKKNRNIIKTIHQIEEADQNSLTAVKEAIYEITNTLLRDRVPIANTLEIVTSLYDRLVARIVELAVKAVEVRGYVPAGSFAFYQMGSSGRGEQFMLTDQDHFLVYEDDTVDGALYFAELGKEISYLLHEAGYARCRGGMMSSEEIWRGTVADWQERLRGWMVHATNDKLLMAQNFYAYRFVTGSSVLHHQFEEAIGELLARSKIFLYRMAQVERERTIPSIDQPIRSLFKLERKSIDMKKEVFFPYHHSVQILALTHGFTSGTPLEKLTRLSEKGVFRSEFVSDIKEAVSYLLTIYVQQRWQQTKNGEEITSIISFTRLSTREKEELIISLRTLRELQTHMLAHFSL